MQKRYEMPERSAQDFFKIACEQYNLFQNTLKAINQSCKKAVEIFQEHMDTKDLNLFLYSLRIITEGMDRAGKKGHDLFWQGIYDYFPEISDGRKARINWNDDNKPYLEEVPCKKK